MKLPDFSGWLSVSQSEELRGGPRSRLVMVMVLIGALFRMRREIRRRTGPIRFTVHSYVREARGLRLSPP